MVDWHTFPSSERNFRSSLSFCKQITIFQNNEFEIIDQCTVLIIDIKFYIEIPHNDNKHFIVII